MNILNHQTIIVLFCCILQMSCGRKKTEPSHKTNNVTTSLYKTTKIKNRKNNVISKISTNKIDKKVVHIEEVRKQTSKFSDLSKLANMDDKQIWEFIEAILANNNKKEMQLLSEKLRFASQYDMAAHVASSLVERATTDIEYTLNLCGLAHIYFIKAMNERKANQVEREQARITLIESLTSIPKGCRDPSVLSTTKVNMSNLGNLYAHDLDIDGLLKVKYEYENRLELSEEELSNLLPKGADYPESLYIRIAHLLKNDKIAQKIKLSQGNLLLLKEYAKTIPENKLLSVRKGRSGKNEQEKSLKKLIQYSIENYMANCKK